MPNWVRNELSATEEVYQSIKGPNSVVDFNMIIPQPELIADGGNADLRVEDWARIALGIDNLKTLKQDHGSTLTAFKSGDYETATKSLRQSILIRLMTEGPFPKDFSDTDFELFLKYIKCLKQYGDANWYSWNTTHWGTKWNAKEARRTIDNLLIFETAWSAPIPVLHALSKKFPKDNIRLRWADEDEGSNTGNLLVRNGEIIEGGPYRDGSKEARKIARDFWGVD